MRQEGEGKDHRQSPRQRSVSTPGSDSYYVEIDGDFDRIAAEMLLLELERIGKRHGAVVETRVKRVVDADQKGSA